MSPFYRTQYPLRLNHRIIGYMEPASTGAGVIRRIREMHVISALGRKIMSYMEWCESIVKELLADEWYQQKSSRERILDQIKEFAEDLRYYYNHRERPEDIAGRWWAITL